MRRGVLYRNSASRKLGRVLREIGEHDREYFYKNERIDREEIERSFAPVLPEKKQVDWDELREAFAPADSESQRLDWDGLKEALASAEGDSAPHDEDEPRSRGF